MTDINIIQNKIGDKNFNDIDKILNNEILDKV